MKPVTTKPMQVSPLPIALQVFSSYNVACLVYDLIQEETAPVKRILSWVARWHMQAVALLSVSGRICFYVGIVPPDMPLLQRLRLPKS